MKFKIYDASVLNKKRNVPAQLGISCVSGCCRINSAARSMVALKPADRIVFVQNEDEPTDWYFRKATEKEDGYMLRDYNGKAKVDTLLFNSAKLVSVICDSLGFKGNSTKCNISNEPIEIDGQVYWQLITGMIKNK